MRKIHFDLHYVFLTAKSKEVHKYLIHCTMTIRQRRLGLIVSHTSNKNKFSDSMK
jgi:hypothetical protein